MKPLLYNEVHQLSLDIVNATAIENTKAEWSAYQKLKLLCEKAQGGHQDHPLQWEALADFTTNYEQALKLYNIALETAESLGLDEYSASIKLAIAIRFEEAGKNKQAIEAAHQANTIAASISNKDLKLEISEFLLAASNQPKLQNKEQPNL